MSNKQMELAHVLREILATLDREPPEKAIGAIDWLELDANRLVRETALLEVALENVSEAAHELFRCGAIFRRREIPDESDIPADVKRLIERSRHGDSLSVEEQERVLSTAPEVVVYEYFGPDGSSGWSRLDAFAASTTFVDSGQGGWRRPLSPGVSIPDAELVENVRRCVRGWLYLTERPMQVQDDPKRAGVLTPTSGCSQAHDAVPSDIPNELYQDAARMFAKAMLRHRSEYRCAGKWLTPPITKPTKSNPTPRTSHCAECIGQLLDLAYRTGPDFANFRDEDCRRVVLITALLHDADFDARAVGLDWEWEPKGAGKGTDCRRWARGMAGMEMNYPHHIAAVSPSDPTPTQTWARLIERAIDRLDLDSSIALRLYSCATIGIPAPFDVIRARLVEIVDRCGFVATKSARLDAPPSDDRPWKAMRPSGLAKALRCDKKALLTLASVANVSCPVDADFRYTTKRYSAADVAKIRRCAAERDARQALSDLHDATESTRLHIDTNAAEIGRVFGRDWPIERRRELRELGELLDHHHLAAPDQPKFHELRKALYARVVELTDMTYPATGDSKGIEVKLDEWQPPEGYIGAKALEAKHGVPPSTLSDWQNKYPPDPPTEYDPRSRERHVPIPWVEERLKTWQKGKTTPVAKR